MEAEAGQQDFKRTSSVLSAGTVSAEPRVSSRLKIADGTPVLLRRFVLHLSKGAAGREPASQEPAQLADSYFPARLADDPVLRSPASVPGGTHEYLKRELGIAIDYADEDLIARMPTPDEVLALRLAPGTPVVELIRTIYMADAEPVEVTIFVCAADRFEFTYRVPMA
jgi:GntR family transcriptional regulator